MNSRSEALFAVETESPSWNIPGIVGELRQLRDASLAGRARSGKPPKLPSRKALIEILDGLRATLFPNRLGLNSLTDEGVDYFVGHTLDKALRELLAVRLAIHISTAPLLYAFCRVRQPISIGGFNDQVQKVKHGDA